MDPIPCLAAGALFAPTAPGFTLATLTTLMAWNAASKNALRLWKWEGGGLSLSAVANNGIVKGRLNESGEVYLTNVIEIIPTTETAEKTFAKFIEDKK